VLGTATNTQVNSSGFQEVAGTSSNTTVSSGAAQLVVLNGTATGTTVQAGGFQAVINAAVNDTALSGSLQVLAGGTSTNTVIAAGGNEYIGAGGSANGTVVNAGALQYVDSGGASTGTIVDGGLQFVAGTASGTTVNSGGEVDVGSGGVANNTQLSAGSEYVYAGGTAQGIDFTGSSGTLYTQNTSGLTGEVSNFAVGDTIDFLNTSVTSSSFDGSTLTLATGGTNYTYQFTGTEAGTTLNVASDGHGGTAVTLALLAQASASLVPGSDGGPIVSSDQTPTAPTLTHAAT